MAFPTRIGGHPIHSMLVPFPIALWIFSFLCDVVVLTGWGGPEWSFMALVTMVAGIVGALAAAVFGFGDYRTLTDARTIRVAKTHMVLNLLLVGLFTVNALLRVGTDTSELGTMLLSAAGLVMLGVSGWLGGELVYVHRVGVRERPADEAGRGKTTAA